MVTEDVIPAPTLESIAIGSRDFIESTQERLGSKAAGRRVEEGNDQCVLREGIKPYNTHFAPEKGPLRSKKQLFVR